MPGKETILVKLMFVETCFWLPEFKYDNKRNIAEETQKIVYKYKSQTNICEWIKEQES